MSLDKLLQERDQLTDEFLARQSRAGGVLQVTEYADAPPRFTTGREAVEALPDSIRVGPFDFSLQKWTSQQSASQHCFGQFAVCEQRISIQLDMPSPQKAAHTLLHELGHALYWTSNFDDADKEERIVATYAAGWLQVFRDNPFILPWLQRCC